MSIFIISGYLFRINLWSLLSVPEEETIRLVVAFGKPGHKSTIVGPRENGGLKYYLDEARNYYVSKRSFEEIVRFV